MIHPSYVELMQVVNNDSTVIGEEPVVNSRYSIVIAAAKRARQIIGGDEPMIGASAGRKPLSVAVQELYEGKVKIISEDDTSSKENLPDHAIENLADYSTDSSVNETANTSVEGSDESLGKRKEELFKELKEEPAEEHYEME